LRPFSLAAAATRTSKLLGLPFKGPTLTKTCSSLNSHWTSSYEREKSLYGSFWHMTYSQRQQELAPVSGWHVR